MLEFAQEFLVNGKVQGVGFRFHTQAKAQQLGLRGDVANLANGAVRVRAMGTADRLEALHRWLAVGPVAAKVTSVVRREIAGFAAERFLIRTDVP